jgi:hypothetical protein
MTIGYSGRVTDGRLDKPAHLEAGPLPATEWLVARLAAVIAVALGALTFVVVAIVEPHLFTTPDWRISVPGFVLTAAAAAVSVARRERAWSLLALGVGLAGAAPVLGWLFGLSIVLAIALTLIVILHAVL